jgi:putative endonuclease
MRQRLYYVYILASKSRRTYIGVTNNLERRIWEHRNRRFAGFTSDYDITSLVHYELTPDVRSAIEREKELKGWRRDKKVALIERDNLGWRDLAAARDDTRADARGDTAPHPA